MTDAAEILEDFAPFADLGTAPPAIVQTEDVIVLRLTRNGDDIELTIRGDQVVERAGPEERKHASLKSLLASPRFADLGKWADSQSLLLRQKVQEETLPMIGSMGDRHGGIEIVDDTLNHGLASGRRNTIVILDGPAGIGKQASCESSRSTGRQTTESHEALLYFTSRAGVAFYKI